MADLKRPECDKFRHQASEGACFYKSLKEFLLISFQRRKHRVTRGAAVAVISSKNAPDAFGQFSKLMMGTWL